MAERRSGKLTAARVARICRWVEKIPNDLNKVARACMIYPADLLYWYALGQTYDCPDPLVAELAWRISEIRGDKAALRQAQLEKAAKGGKKRKVLAKRDETGKMVPQEVTVETVLPNLAAVERLEAQANESLWEVSPNDAVAKDLIDVFESSREVLQLTEGSLGQQPEADSPSDGDSAGVHPGPIGPSDVSGGAPAREDGCSSD
jgi:hypothetical protein